VIQIGTYNTLSILRKTTVGLYLGDSTEDVLLPNKYCPDDVAIGESLEVFVYRDYAGRKVATTLTPDIVLHECALLQVADITDVGVFMDWGLEKHLLVPFSEQVDKMEVGKWYVVYLDVDPKTDRLFATQKIGEILDNSEVTVAQGEAVDVLVYRKTELGYSVIVNSKHAGLIFANEVFKEIRVGDKLRGFVKKIREANKLDIALQPMGYRNFNEGNTEVIYSVLQRNDGFLAVTDKSSPEQIYAQFGMSKKAFKKAIGALYKERRLSIEADGIRML